MRGGGGGAVREDDGLGGGGGLRAGVEVWVDALRSFCRELLERCVLPDWLVRLDVLSVVSFMGLSK